MTVGFHSPLPPARSGVADYSAALLKALRRLGRVEVAAARADVHLYHVGNNPLHWKIYQQALRSPGVVVLHDAVLHHFLLGRLDEKSYVDEFVFNYGEWNRSLAQRLWANRSSSGAASRYFDYPMLKRLAQASAKIVVHNQAAAAVVRRHAPGAAVFEIPHLFEPPAPPPGYEVERLRSGLGVTTGTCLFGVFGHLRESKRILPVLRVFSRLHAGARLLIAGDFVSTDLARAAAGLLSQPGIIRLPYAPQEDFWQLAHACDAVINLRYPAAGETSGITVRMMGIGKPVLVTGSAENASFPDDCVVRVDSGPAEEAMLEHMLVWLANSVEARREFGRRAAAHIGEHHALDRVARQYWRLLVS